MQSESEPDIFDAGHMTCIKRPGDNTCCRSNPYHSQRGQVGLQNAPKHKLNSFSMKSFFYFFLLCSSNILHLPNTCFILSDWGIELTCISSRTLIGIGCFMNGMCPEFPAGCEFQIPPLFPDEFVIKILTWEIRRYAVTTELPLTASSLRSECEPPACLQEERPGLSRHEYSFLSLGFCSSLISGEIRRR